MRAAMRFFRDFSARPGPHPTIVIGAFDGLHRGHLALLRAAATSGGPWAMLCFEPLPKEYFLGAKSPNTEWPPRLTTAVERLRLMADGTLPAPDTVWQLRFNHALAALEAEAFVATILVSALGVRQVIVGEDFRFGRGRIGDVALLATLGRRHGFTVEAVPMVLENGIRISSSRVRATLAAGDLDGARRLLGRPFDYTGRVSRGLGMGRRLGFATANFSLHRRRLPLAGIFAVRVRPAGGGPWYDGVASAGVRPTLGDGGQPLLEVHLFDYDGDLYGRRLTVRFIARLRDEQRFDDLEAMTRQMALDAAAARAALAACQ